MCEANQEFDRRNFMKKGAVATTAAAASVVSGNSAQAGVPEDKKITFSGALPIRKLGKTGEELPILGYGGAALPKKWGNTLSDEDRVKLVRHAYDSGIRYFDTAIRYTYADSQAIIGQALKEVRDDVFITALSILLRGLAATMLVGTSLLAVELPAELPLWENGSPEHPFRLAVEEQVRTHEAALGSPTGQNRVFSSVSSPTYCIHRPEKPNGVGLVICPGGGFRDIWIDREGHDLAIWLKDYHVTSLVLKYRTRPAEMTSREMWQDYQNAVQADGRQAIRILRDHARDLGLDPQKIGICGFSAGGHLAISCALYGEPKFKEPETSGMPDFAGLFYPAIPDDAQQWIESRSAPESATRPICPMFVVNARVDDLTPADKCVDFYASLLRADVNAELHIFSKGSHGFDLGTGRGQSLALWPTSFVAWLRDCEMIEP